MASRIRQFSLMLGVLAWGASACCAQSDVKGRVSDDGSSTVAPIMTAFSSECKKVYPNLTIPVGTSGTGGGFKKFLDADPKLRTDISNASRPIKPEELQLAQKNGIQFIELPIALDGMAVAVNPKNNWCDHLTIAELRKIWAPGSKLSSWKEVRDGFPDKPLKLFGPGTDSGTYDYFCEAVVGGKSTRNDFQASEDDNTLVRGVASNEGGLGYFGFSYYENNQKSLKLLGIDNGDGKPVKPDLAKIRSNEYRPLSRPLFIYVNRDASERPEVQAFIAFMFDNMKRIVEHPRVGYVSLPPELYDIVRDRFKNRVTGTVYTDAASHQKPLEALFKAPAKSESP